MGREIDEQVGGFNGANMGLIYPQHGDNFSRLQYYNLQPITQRENNVKKDTYDKKAFKAWLNTKNLPPPIAGDPAT